MPPPRTAMVQLSSLLRGTLATVLTMRCSPTQKCEYFNNAVVLREVREYSVRTSTTVR